MFLRRGNNSRSSGSDTDIEMSGDESAGGNSTPLTREERTHTLSSANESLFQHRERKQNNLIRIVVVLLNLGFIGTYIATIVINKHRAKYPPTKAKAKNKATSPPSINTNFVRVTNAPSPSTVPSEAKAQNKNSSSSHSFVPSTVPSSLPLLSSSVPTFIKSQTPSITQLPSLLPSQTPTIPSYPSLSLSQAPSIDLALFQNKIWTQIGNDIAPSSNNITTSIQDRAGTSISLSSDGTVIAIGATHYSSEDKTNRGRVLIYQLQQQQQQNDEEEWIRVQEIMGEHTGDLMGYSVALSGDGLRLAVGSIGYDGNDNQDITTTTTPRNTNSTQNITNSNNIGMVQIYQKQLQQEENQTATTTPTWLPIATFTGQQNDSLFGASTSLSHDGSTIAIGAPHFSTNNIYRSGAVYTYIHDSISSPNAIFENETSTSWVEMDDIIKGDATEDLFGWSVSLSHDGMTLLVGAPKDGALVDESGYARVYQYTAHSNDTTNSDDDGDDNDGNQTQNSTADDNSSSNGTSTNLGKINASWQQSGDTFSRNTPGDQFGSSVSLSGNGQVLSIGSPRATNLNDDVNSGLVATYHHYQKSQQSVSNTTTNDTSTNGNGQNDDELSWIQLPDLYGASPDDNFGHSVSLSYNGDTMAVGIPWHFNSILNITTGQVIVYKLQQQYEQQSIHRYWIASNEINGMKNQEEKEEHVGHAVSLSYNGTVVGIGDPTSSVVRVYN